jgi:AcrR family transcriptional regulator
MHILRRAPYGDNAQVGERARQTYDRILQAAARVFERYGFQDARIDDIASSARTARATVYQYFESKDEILQALSNQMGARLLALANELPPIEDNDAGIQQLRAWIDELLLVAVEFAPVVDTWFDPAAQSGELHEMGKDFMHRFVKRLGAKLQAAARPDYDIEVVSVMIFAIVDAIGGEIARKQLDVPRDTLLDELAAMFHAALFPASA